MATLANAQRDYRVLIEHLLRWAPFGGPPAEETFLRFGLSPAQVARRVSDFLGRDGNEGTSDKEVTLRKVVTVLLAESGAVAGSAHDDNHVSRAGASTHPACTQRTDLRSSRLSRDPPDPNVTQRPVDRSLGRGEVKSVDNEIDCHETGIEASGPFPWQVHARCRGYPTDVFFHAEHERGATRHTNEARAKQFCDDCAVISECLKHALSWPELYGVWGGTTPAERITIREGNKR